jgi:hypothetical protein
VTSYLYCDGACDHGPWGIEAMFGVRTAMLEIIRVGEDCEGAAGARDGARISR